jgi:hypothetical protein
VARGDRGGMSPERLRVAVAVEPRMFGDALTTALCPAPCEPEHVLNLDADEVVAFAARYDVVVVSRPVPDEVHKATQVIEVAPLAGPGPNPPAAPSISYDLAELVSLIHL